ncbi:MAG: chloride channel protein [Acetobacteraceae bacterium]
MPSAGGVLLRGVRPRTGALVEAHHRGPDRGECAAWRPHVAERQPDHVAADGAVERRRRVGGAGGRLQPRSAAAVGSRIGRAFRVRRNDLRLLVGCGAAGGIAAAFQAPLTGSFYAFELVIGTYLAGDAGAGGGVFHLRGVRGPAAERGDRRVRHPGAIPPSSRSTTCR